MLLAPPVIGDLADPHPERPTFARHVVLGGIAEKPGSFDGYLPDRPIGVAGRAIGSEMDEFRSQRDQYSLIVTQVGRGCRAQPGELQDIADAAAAELKRGYLGFEGAAPSESTVERKRGTEGTGRQLVGPHGPRLIEHIEGKVDS